VGRSARDGPAPRAAHETARAAARVDDCRRGTPRPRSRRVRRHRQGRRPGPAEPSQQRPRPPRRPQRGAGAPETNTTQPKLQRSRPEAVAAQAKAVSAKRERSGRGAMRAVHHVPAYRLRSPPPVVTAISSMPINGSGRPVGVRHHRRHAGPTRHRHRILYLLTERPVYNTMNDAGVRCDHMCLRVPEGDGAMHKAIPQRRDRRIRPTATRRRARARGVEPRDWMRPPTRAHDPQISQHAHSETSACSPRATDHPGAIAGRKAILIARCRTRPATA